MTRIEQGCNEGHCTSDLKKLTNEAIQNQIREVSTGKHQEERKEQARNQKTVRRYRSNFRGSHSCNDEDCTLLEYDAR
jgi:hypothetical protein